MIIEIEGCGFRISGSDTEWQVQYPHKRKDGSVSWDGKYFYPALKWALDKVRELMLQDSPDVAASFADVVKQVDKANAKLLRAVNKAIQEPK